MSDYKIANGHNNTAGLQFLWQLSPPLFSLYRADLRTEWHDYEARIMNGNRRYDPIGLPWVAWTFAELSTTEYEYLADNFGASVTIRTWQKSEDTFANFNANFILPDLGEYQSFLGGVFRNVRFEFRDLVAL